MLKFDERFNSEPFRELRRTAAKSLMQKGKENPDEVLDFFETIGFLLRRRAVDEEMVWHTFFYWIDGYWNAAHDYVKARKDPTFYEDTEYLYERMVSFEKRKYGHYDKPPADEVRKFLEGESELPLYHR